MIEQLQIPAGALAFLALVLLFYRPVWGMCALAAIYPINVMAPRLPVPGLNTETILIGVSLALTLLRYGVHVPPLRYSGPVIAFIGVIFASFVISLPWARSVRIASGDAPIWQIFQTFKSQVFTAFLFFPAYWWFKDPRDRRLMLQAISLAGLSAAVFGIIDYIVPIHPKSTGGRAMGLFADPNSMAQVLGVTMFSSLYLVLHARDLSRGTRLFHLVAYGLSGIAIVLSLSRGNWLALVASHFVYFLFVNRRLLALGLAGMVLAGTIAFPLLPSIVQDRITQTSENRGKTVFRVPGAANLEGSAAFRLVSYRMGMEMFRESPVWGHGLHFFNLNSPKYGAKYGVLTQKDAHSLPLKMATETGLLGLGVLTWVILTGLMTGRRLWYTDTPEYGMGAVLMAVFVYVLVANLTSTAFLYAKPIAAYFWIQLALASRAYVERDRVTE